MSGVEKLYRGKVLAQLAINDIAMNTTELAVATGFPFEAVEIAVEQLVGLGLVQRQTGSHRYGCASRRKAIDWLRTTSPSALPERLR